MVGVPALVWVAVGLVAIAAQAPAPAPGMPDVLKLGPQVGSRVPEFTLVDQHGQKRTLASLMGSKGLMLVFYRSADWCPYCKTQLAELETRTNELRRKDLGLAAISYDPVPVLADFTARRHISFPLLSDSGSAVIRQYGIFNTTIPESNRQSFGIPFPGTFILNRQGVVTSRFFESAYQERTTVGSMLVRLGNDIDIAAMKISSPQLEISTYATDQTVAPGTHFSIVLDVKPAARVHVYAPGAADYKVIALTVKPQPGLLVRAAQYPTPEDYFFRPLNEHVPVFQKPFRLAQDLMIDASAETQAALKDVASMTVNGMLSYQACDDKVCFAPQSVPLAWTVKVRQLDRERANTLAPK
jgi:peroxiredoxin